MKEAGVGTWAEGEEGDGVMSVPRSHLAYEQQTYFRSYLRKITSAIPFCELVSVTSVFLRQSEFGSSICGANTRGLYVGISMSARKTKWRKMGRVH